MTNEQRKAAERLLKSGVSVGTLTKLRTKLGLRPGTRQLTKAGSRALRMLQQQPPLSDAEIARVCGLSRARVGQIKKRLNPGKKSLQMAKR